MEDAENLAEIFNVLQVQWTKLSLDLTDEDLTFLKTELASLEKKMETINNVTEIDELSKNFIQIFSNLEPLEFLTNIDKINRRSGALPELDEEIRMKIINYCVMLQEKINSLKDERKMDQKD